MKKILIYNKVKYKIKDLFRYIIKDCNIQSELFSLTQSPIKIIFSDNLTEPELRISYEHGKEYDDMVSTLSIHTLFSSLMSTKMYPTFAPEDSFIESFKIALTQQRYKPYTGGDGLEENLLERLKEDYKTGANDLDDIFARAFVDGIIKQEDNPKNPLTIVEKYISNRLENTFSTTASQFDFARKEVTEDRNYLIAGPDMWNDLLNIYICNEYTLPIFKERATYFEYHLPMCMMHEMFYNSYYELSGKPDTIEIIIDDDFFDYTNGLYNADILIYACDLSHLPTLDNNVSTTAYNGIIELETTVVNDICVSGALFHPINTYIFVFEVENDVIDYTEDFLRIYRIYFEKIKSLDFAVSKSIIVDKSSTSPRYMIDIDRLREIMLENVEKINKLDAIKFSEEDKENEGREVIKKPSLEINRDNYYEFYNYLQMLYNAYYVKLIEDPKTIFDISENEINFRKMIIKNITNKKIAMKEKIMQNSDIIIEHIQKNSKILENACEVVVSEFIRDLKACLQVYSLYMKESANFVLCLARGSSNELINRLIYQNSYTDIYDALQDLNKIDGFEDGNLYLDTITNVLQNLNEDIRMKIKEILSTVNYEQVLKTNNYAFLCDLISDNLK